MAADQVTDDAARPTASLDGPGTVAAEVPARADGDTGVGIGTIILLVLATAGAGMATLVPATLTLALRLDEIAPGRQDLLGYVLGANALSSLITTPLTGILSDRTRTRWGRRHPFTVAGLALGLLTLPIMIYAPDVWVLAAGWMLSSLGFGTASGSIGNFQADRLPPHQRGKVAGLAGMAMQVSPVLGVVLAGTVTGDMLWVFLLPALVGTAAMLAFVVFVHEDDSRRMEFEGRLSVGRVIRSFGFNPRQAPAFAWNWLGRSVFFFALSFTTTYTSFFYAQRLGLAVADVVPVLASLSTASVVASCAGSIGAGWLSDRVGRRRPFVLTGALVFAAGCLVTAAAWDVRGLLAGTLVTSFGIAVFAASNQALVLDVMPDRESQAGRYSAIVAFSQKIPNAIGPLVAPALLGLGAGDGADNYSVLYLVAAGLAVVGGVIIAAGARQTR